MAVAAIFSLVVASSLVSCDKNDLQEESNNQAEIPQGRFYVSHPKILEDSVSSELRAGVDRRYLWQPGKKIKVKFAVVQDANLGTELLAKSCFLDWMQYANLNFEFVESGEDMIVAIYEHPLYLSQGQSVIGRGCLTAHRWGQSSVDLIIGADPLEVRRGVILHEFGHVLGFLHEHQVYPIDWNEEAVYNYFRRSGLSDEVIYANVLQNDGIDGNAINVIKDRKSVMTYGIPAGLTNDGFTSQQNFKLSSGDKTIAKNTYPHKYPNSKPFVRTKRSCGMYFYCDINEILVADWEDLLSGYERVECRLFPSSTSGVVPLYRYNSDKTGDHFYTTDWNELGYGKGTYKYEYVAGYVFPNKVDGTIPLYRYYRPSTNSPLGKGDHFYTTDWNELGNGKNGYRYERIAGYVLPASEN